MNRSYNELMGKRKHINTKLVQYSAGVDSTHVMLKVFTPSEKHDPLQNPLRVNTGPLLTRQAMYHGGCFIFMSQEGKFFTWIFYRFPFKWPFTVIFTIVYISIRTTKYAHSLVVLDLVFLGFCPYYSLLLYWHSNNHILKCADYIYMYQLILPWHWDAHKPISYDNSGQQIIRIFWEIALR